MKPSHKSTESKYQKYRQDSRNIAEQTLPGQYAERVSLRNVSKRV